MKKVRNRFEVKERSYIEYVMEGDTILVYRVQQTKDGSFLMRRVVKIYK